MSGEKVRIFSFHFFLFWDLVFLSVELFVGFHCLNSGLFLQLTADLTWIDLFFPRYFCEQVLFCRLGLFLVEWCSLNLLVAAATVKLAETQISKLLQKCPSLRISTGFKASLLLFEHWLIALSTQERVQSFFLGDFPTLRKPTKLQSCLKTIVYSVLEKNECVTKIDVYKRDMQTNKRACFFSSLSKPCDTSKPKHSPPIL